MSVPVLLLVAALGGDKEAHAPLSLNTQTADGATRSAMNLRLPVPGTLALMALSEKSTFTLPIWYENALGPKGEIGSEGIGHGSEGAVGD